MSLKKQFISQNQVRIVEDRFRVSDLFQTYLPALMIIVLAALFIYNLGYFYALDWRYLSLLRTQDYYSGMLPVLIFVLILYSSLVVQVLDNPDWAYQQLLQKLRVLWAEYDEPAVVLGQIKELKSALWSSKIEKASLYMQLWEIKLKNACRKLLHRPGRRISTERVERLIKGENNQYEKLLYKYELSRKRTWPELKKMLVIGARICGWSILAAVAVTLICFLILIPIYGKVWVAEPQWLGWGLLFTALVVLADIGLQTSYRSRGKLLIASALLGSFYCGVLGYHQDLLQKSVNVIDKEAAEHHLIRAVSRGYFVREGDEVLFIPKANALRLEQQVQI